MKQREIKFRFWSTDLESMSIPMELKEIVNNELFEIPMQYTGLKDKNGKEIYEGDVVEYYDWCYCTDGVYKENGDCTGRVLDTEIGFIERAKANGYTAEERWTPFDDTEWCLLHKPMRGVVKFNEMVGAYEPLVSSQEDYNNACFYYVIQNMDEHEKGTKAYCEVLGNIYENPELVK